MSRHAGAGGRSARISLSSIVVAGRGQVSCDLDGEAAILGLEDGIYYGLDPVGTRIWSIVQRPVPVAEILRALLDDYDVEADRCREDLLGLLGDLAAARPLEVEDGPSS